MSDCPSCGLRLETIKGNYKKQTFRQVKPYCANSQCKLSESTR